MDFCLYITAELFHASKMAVPAIIVEASMEVYKLHKNFVTRVGTTDLRVELFPYLSQP